MTQVRLRLFKGGYCTHSQKMVLRTASSQTIAFPSMFGLIEHPTQGAILFDTGYASHFFTATERFPERFYRILTPVTLDSCETAVAQLQQVGYLPEQVRYVLISHFHGDHVAALKDFPQARYVFLESGYRAVKPLKGFQAVKIGFLPSLLPSDFESRVLPLAPDSALATEAVMPFESSYDLFGDGSIRLIPLEGHFCGQMGALLNTQAGQVFLIADACWLRESFEKLILPHPLAMSIMYNRQAYRRDLEQIRSFYQANPLVQIIPSHCSRSIGAYLQSAQTV